jgi:prevent-host-death family protein
MALPIDHSVNVHQAKTHLSQLLQQVEQGSEVVIARSGVPIARLVPWQPARQGIAPPARSRSAATLMRLWTRCLNHWHESTAARHPSAAVVAWLNWKPTARTAIPSIGYWCARAGSNRCDC